MEERGREMLCSRGPSGPRSEEHTSELQSRLHLVCRLLLEKKNERKTDVDALAPREINASNACHRFYLRCPCAVPCTSCDGPHWRAPPDPHAAPSTRRVAPR